MMVLEFAKPTLDVIGRHPAPTRTRSHQKSERETNWLGLAGGHNVIKLLEFYYRGRREGEPLRSADCQRAVLV